jgi:hypothetical protein
MAVEYYYARLLDRADATDPPMVANCGPGCHGVGGDSSNLDDDIVAAIGRAGLDSTADLDQAAPGLDETEATLLRRRVAEEVLTWARGLHAGDVGGGWTRWATGLLEPKLDWRRVLHGSMRRAVGAVSGAADYSYRKPSRRRVRRVVLPSLVRPLPRVAIVVDTSGSIDDHELGRAWTEVRGCLRSLGVRRDLLRVYAGDVGATRVNTITSQSVALLGGGGTDMAAAIAEVLYQRPRPDIVVVLTDGYTPWPDRAPTARVIIGLLGEYPEDVPLPGWAQVVVIPADDGTAGA